MSKSNDIKGLFTCECGAPVKNRMVCDDCVRAGLIARNSPHFNSLMVARKCDLSYFFSECPDHGLTKFTTETDRCQICEPPRGAPARVLARRAGETQYLDACETHGPDTIFSVNSGKCLRCFNAVGAKRPARRSARADARKAGRVRYTAQCRTCGPGQHSVVTGKCLTCHTTAGVLRVRPLTP